MIKFFKQRNNRQLSNDPAVAALFPIFPCGKAAVVQETSKQSLIEKDDDETKIGDNDGLSHVGFASSTSEDEPVMSEHPNEPCEIDHPIRCPHPEPCIIQDGRALKKRLPSIKRKGQLPFLTKSEVQRLSFSCRSAPSDFRTYPAATALEPS